MEKGIEYDLVFLTTHQDNRYIFKYLDSISCNSSLKLYILILSQEVTVEFSNVNQQIENLQIAKMSLSKARNIGLKYLSEKGISSKYIMFPDDDSTFDLNFFEEFNQLTRSGKNFIIPIYCENSDKKLYLGKKLAEDTPLNYNHHYMIGSPNQIISYNRNVSNIYFDENLGVGALYGSCEDFDLFLRLIESGESFLFTSKLYNYHPEKTNSFANLDSSLIYKRLKSYSLGFIYTVQKHKLYSLLLYFFVRPMLAAFYYILKFNFRLVWIYSKLFFFRVINTIKFLIK